MKDFENALASLEVARNYIIMNKDIEDARCDDIVRDIIGVEMKVTLEAKRQAVKEYKKQFRRRTNDTK